MNARIVVLGSPRAAGAVLPAMTETAEAASAGVCRVTGAPGTMPVPSPRPAAVPRLTENAHGARVQPSACSPTYFRPAIYVATPACGHPPVYRGPDRLSPVPAIRPVLAVATVPPRMARPKRIGGKRVTRAARPLVVWPTYGGGYG